MQQRIIDFRARPNTREYLALYGPGANQSPLDFRDFRIGEKPSAVPLSTFIDSMDEAGIAKAVFTGRQLGACVLPNDYVAECANAYPDRIVGIGAVDPLNQKADAWREAKRAVRDLGLRGLSVDLWKIYADDRLLYPVYNICLENDVPVILTLGARIGPYNDPNPIANLASDLPELMIVCSHASYPRVDEYIALAFAFKNVYLEPSIYHFMPGAEILLQAAADILQDKIVYASGYPFEALDDVKRYIGHPFHPDVRDKLLYGNAAHLLKI